jgi:NitT/TauT family transport system substrate-binding protein
MDENQLRIGHLSTFYHTSFILEGTKWLEESGLDVKWNLFASGPDMIRAFANNEIDLGYIGLPPVMIGIANGIPLKCIAGGHVEGTVMIARRSFLENEQPLKPEEVLRQFEGNIIGVPPKGSIHDVILRDIISKDDLNIEVRNYPWADFVVDALVDSEIQAGVGTPAMAVSAGRHCDAKIVLPPSSLWPNNPSYGIVMREEMSARSEQLEIFLTQHERASNFIRSYPSSAAKIVAELTGTVDPQFVEDTYAISPKYCSAISDEFIEATMRFGGVLQRLGYLNRSPTMNDIFELGYIRKVHPDRPHYNRTYPN